MRSTVKHRLIDCSETWTWEARQVVFCETRLTRQEVRQSVEVVTDTLKQLQEETRQHALFRSEMLRDVQDALHAVNAAGLGAWDGVRNQGADVVQSLATNIRESYHSMTAQIRDQVRSLDRARLTL